MRIVSGITFGDARLCYLSFYSSTPVQKSMAPAGNDASSGTIKVGGFSAGIDDYGNKI